VQAIDVNTIAFILSVIRIWI